MSEGNRDRLLEAAKLAFSRYGYRRTTMGDVAELAGMSRPAVYLSFPNKRAVFDALALAIRDQALAAGEAAWPPGAPLGTSLPAAILAKDLPLYRLLHASAHGAELMAVDEALTAEITRDLEAAFARFLAGRAAALAGSGAIDLAAFGTAEDFGTTVGLIAAGLKHEAVDEAAYADSVHRFCRLVEAATRPR